MEERDFIITQSEKQCINMLLPLCRYLSEGRPVGDNIQALDSTLKSETGQLSEAEKRTVLLCVTLYELAVHGKYHILEEKYRIPVSKERIAVIEKLLQDVANAETPESKETRSLLVRRLHYRVKIPSRKLYIADLHFYHENLNHRMDKRGFSDAEEMNAHMIRQWNDHVTKKDEVYILGDFSIARGEPTNRILKELAGKKYLITGNHDKFLDDKAFDPNFFEWIRPYAEIQDNRRNVILSHYPVFCYKGQYRKQNGVPFVYMLYGHVHNTMDEVLVNRFITQTRETLVMSAHSPAPEPIPCQMINCFCMFSDYIPMTLDEWIGLDAHRREQMKREV